MAATELHANSATNALGTVLGYIGAEAATDTIFTRLLWPHRSYADFRIRKAFKMALLLPSGGPLYKAVLQTLDSMWKNGLLRGRQQGHMLGSPFFPDRNCLYTMYDAQDPSLSLSESSRNNIWAGVVSLLSSPIAYDSSQTFDDIEKASKIGKGYVRSRVAVHHITLSVNKNTKQNSNAVATIDEERSCSMQSILGMFTAELTAIGVALAVALMWNSWFALLWLCPLELKLLSAILAVEREPLNLGSSGLLSSPHKDFEIHMPSETGSFLLITGPPELVLQYFRHYGHPKRNRVREIAQLGIVATFGCLFPIGLLCSVAWMPLPVQYVWLSYQMYVVGAMYVTRYMEVERWASLEEKIAERLAEAPSKGQQEIWYDDTLGLSVNAALESAFFGRYGSGQSHMKSLLNRNGQVSSKSP